MRERRFRKPRSPRRVFLVICEGDSERVYVEALKKYYRLPITVKTKVCGNSVNARLVSQYLKELDLNDDDDYSIFYIYDCDVLCVVEKLRRLKGTLLLSNPCFELWYLLHALEHTRTVNSDSVVKLLIDSHPVWKKYTKGIISANQLDMLIERRNIAANRASRMHWPDNPSTNIHVFLDALENAKNS